MNFNAVRISAFITAVTFMFCGCAKRGGENEGDRPRVVTTIFPAYDFARQIAGDAVSLEMLVPPGGDSHEYEPTFSDLAAVRECDLAVYSGTEADGWFSDLFSALPEGASAVSLHGFAGGSETDDHEWMSLRNAEKMVRGICSALCGIDPANRPNYTRNAERFIGGLRMADAGFAEVTSSPEGILCVADVFPCVAFAADYGLRYVSVFEHCAEGSEPGLAEIAEVRDTVLGHRTPLIVYTERSGEETARFIAEKSGCGYAAFTTMQNISKEDFENGETYLSLQSRNLAVLERALGYAS